MSHTLHRRGTTDSLKNDYVIFAMSAKGINEAGSHVKLQRFLEIIRQFNPVNLGDMKTGNSFITSPETIIGNTKDTSIVHGVFDNREALIKALKAVKEADLGVSVIISGLLDDVHECCRQAGVDRHTCETSLGIWGKTERLPDEDILRFTTMCGHGMVAFSLVKKMIEDIKAGRRTVREAAEELAKPCQCGVFNPSRAAAMLEEILCLWGVRIA
ncbi:conserved hypothetical protein [Thermosinus carboxydivorans Nor1]|uniref:Uncharacterized protein n=1 Tax=Thermosinus carboxydivorans Nor1 TaxID=401526 RepID=A1HNI0_9FIRM|nr:hypothetical protein [Thermosinus carboxydivorans]EAX48339.1 conserved hypothetical protein [Thermosinus carboxydivorans Nor1]